MPRRKWRLRNRREPLSPAMRVYLELGPGGLVAVNEATPLDGYSAARFFDGEWVRAAAWREHGAAITAAWILEHPGTRPWGWWVYAAWEGRRCVAGAELLVPKQAPTDWDWVWRESFGVPAFRQSRPCGYRGLPAVESQAEYLDRLGLLGVEEQAALTAHAFDPEVIDPFVVDAADTTLSEEGNHP